MERPFIRWFRAYILDAMIVVSAALGAWAAWGSPSPVTLTWVAVVSVGLVIVTALAVRDGSPTRSVAHVLYETEHPVSDARRDVPRGVATESTR
ncbi:MAG: hypothetical protein ABR606_08040 [Vicinamibacterales bacterium]